MEEKAMKKVTTAADPVLTAFGAEVKRLREEKKLTQSDLGKLVGVSKSSICLLEGGKRMPDLNRCLALALALDKALEDLVKVAHVQN